MNLNDRYKKYDLRFSIKNSTGIGLFVWQPLCRSWVYFRGSKNFNFTKAEFEKQRNLKFKKEFKVSSALDFAKRRPKMFIQAKIPAEMYDQLVKLADERSTTKSALVLCGLSLLLTELERERNASQSIVTRASHE